MTYKCRACRREFQSPTSLRQHQAAKRDAIHKKVGAKIPAREKATHCRVTQELLDARYQRSAEFGYSKQKWILFCEAVLAMGLTATLYEARQTPSKYITVSNGKLSYKVRFSNHRPILAREEANDCDFFVGVNNKSITTTQDAIAAVHAHFGGVRSAA